MSSQTESVAKLRQSLNEAEKQLQALLEKREMCKSALAKLDSEERALSKKLQESKDKFRALVAANPPPAQQAAQAAKQAPPTGLLQSVAQFENLAEALPEVGFAPVSAPEGTEPRKVSGPETEDTYTIEDVVAARTVSTYPMLPGGKKRVCSIQHIFSFLQNSSVNTAITRHNQTRICVFCFVIFSFFSSK